MFIVIVNVGTILILGKQVSFSGLRNICAGFCANQNTGASLCLVGLAAARQTSYGNYCIEKR